MISFEAQSYFRRYRQLVLPTITLLVVVVLSLTVVVPQVLQAYNDWRSLGDLNKKRAVLIEKGTVLENLDAGELTVKVREVVTDVPTDEDLGYFVGSLRGTVERSGSALYGVQLVGVAEVQAASVSAATTVRTAKPSGKERSIPLAVNVKGSLDGLRQLLTDIDSSAPLSETQGFSFSRNLKDEVFSGSLTVRFFFSPLPTTIGAVDLPLSVITSADETIYEQLAQLKKIEDAAGTLPEVETGQEEFIR